MFIGQIMTFENLVKHCTFIFVLQGQTQAKSDKVNTWRTLTITTTVYLQSESNPPSGVPVQRNQAEEASYHRLIEFVLDHSVCITVTWKSLKKTNKLTCFLYFVQLSLMLLQQRSEGSS